MSCMSSVSYNILINGSPNPCIMPSRGLRQGDHISPFLFLLCTKDLLASLVSKERLGVISGICVKPSNPLISHLLFVDDYYIFSEICMVKINVIIETLSDFGLALSLIIAPILLGNSKIGSKCLSH